jgi:uncharacterized membrane protein YhiD involved in acid resistance
MFELFPDQPVYDYPTLINVGYSLVWALLLSSIIAITHKITHTGPSYPKHLFQTIALGSIIAAMIMMAIGDSLARGLGAFGALAMIRFRTRIQDPKNMIYIFASLSSGLAVGVFGFTIAFTGTMLFCCFALILHYSDITTRNEIKARVNIKMEKKAIRSQVSSIISEQTKDYHEKSTILREDRVECNYDIVLPFPNDHYNLLESLQSLDGVDRVSINYNQNMEDI